MPHWHIHHVAALARRRETGAAFRLLRVSRRVCAGHRPVATPLPVLHPMKLFFWTLAAGTLFCLVGALLAVPVAALVHILLDEIYLRPRRLEIPGIDNAAGKLAKGKQRSRSRRQFRPQRTQIILWGRERRGNRRFRNSEPPLKQSASSADEIGVFNARIPHPRTPARSGTPCARCPIPGA